jgi:ribosomal-protein-alanine N-acetyltransferase
VSALICSVGPEAAEVLAALHADALGPGWPAAEFRKILEAPGSFCLLVGRDPPLGMLAAWTAADEAEILALAVTAAARRRGYARDLVAAAIAEAGRRGARALFLEVGAANAPARALYQALGFRQAGQRRNYYKRPGGAEDALILRLEIAPASAPLDLHARRP